MTAEQARTTHSIVIPVFDEHDGLPALHAKLRELVGALAPDDLEILLVNDGSRDGSEELLDAMAQQDPRLHVLHLSRNFGHQLAITAGVDAATGDTVTVIDADLQDPPEVIPLLIEKWREGFEVVYAVRRVRPGETVLKRWTAAAFYRVIRALISIDLPADAGDFRLMDRKVVHALRRMEEQHRFVRGMVSWVGFCQTRVLYDREARPFGKSHYPWVKMFLFALDGITSFSIAPLRFATVLGFAAAVFALCSLVWAVYIKYFTDTAVLGWLSVMCAVLFVGAAQLITLGILGEYIGRIYHEVKRRPLYLVKRRVR